MLKSIPKVTSENKIFMMFVGSLLFGVMYLGAGHFPTTIPHPSPKIFLDANIPLLPWTIIIYLSQFVFLALGFWFAPNPRMLNQTYYGYLLATIIATVVFLVYPSQLPRIDMASKETAIVHKWFFMALYRLDVPNNCLPSLHTTLALFAANSLRYRRKWRYIAPLWAIAIMISTLTTYQHTILDVAAGVVLFVFTVYICERKLPL